MLNHKSIIHRPTKKHALVILKINILKISMHKECIKIENYLNLLFIYNIIILYMVLKIYKIMIVKYIQKEIMIK